MKRHNAYSAISQMPVVLIPIQFDRQIYLNDHEEINNNKDENIHERIIPLTRLRPIASSFQHSVVLRTFITKDFMTGRPAVPGETFPLEMLDEMCQTIKTNVPGISRILYDLTSKPPGREFCKDIFLYIILFFCFFISNDRMGIKNSQNSSIFQRTFLL
jgi:GMP synthase (glutamine-hydrolysing)